MRHIQIDIRPDWAQAMEALLLVLEAGTEKGKALAREELRELARKLDAMALAQAGSYVIRPTDDSEEMAEAGCYTCDAQLTAEEHAHGDGNCLACFEKGEQS